MHKHPDRLSLRHQTVRKEGPTLNLAVSLSERHRHLRAEACLPGVLPQLRLVSQPARLLESSSLEIASPSCNGSASTPSSGGIACSTKCWSMATNPGNCIPAIMQPSLVISISKCRTTPVQFTVSTYLFLDSRMSHEPSLPYLVIKAADSSLGIAPWYSSQSASIADTLSASAASSAATKLSNGFAPLKCFGALRVAERCRWSSVRCCCWSLEHPRE